MERNELVENLRTTILWENVHNYVEDVKQAHIILQGTSLINEVTIETAVIEDSEDFYIVNVIEDNGRIIVHFEMPFILCVNRKYNIQGVAVGNLDLPSAEDFAYDKYDFLSMGKEELLSFANIVCISKIGYEDVEILGLW